MRLTDEDGHSSVDFSLERGREGGRSGLKEEGEGGREATHQQSLLESRSVRENNVLNTTSFGVLNLLLLELEIHGVLVVGHDEEEREKGKGKEVGAVVWREEDEKREQISEVRRRR